MTGTGIALQGNIKTEVGVFLQMGAVPHRDAVPPKRYAVGWVRVLPSEVAQLAQHRPRLADKKITPSVLAGLGVLGGGADGGGEVELERVLRDEARRMDKVCETREELVAYLSKWALLVVGTPGRRTRKRHRYPLPMTEEAIADYAVYQAKTTATTLYIHREALAEYFASLPQRNFTSSTETDAERPAW